MEINTGRLLVGLLLIGSLIYAGLTSSELLMSKWHVNGHSAMFR